MTKRPPGRQRLLWTAGLLLLGVVFAWLFFPKQKPPSYETAAAERGLVERTIVATGKIRPTRTVEVGAEVSGLVSAVHVDIDTPVRAGQILAEIEPTRLDAAVRQADALIRVAEGGVAEAEASIARERANVREAEVTMRRSASLAGQGLLSPSGLEKAEAVLARTRAALRGATAQRQSRAAELARAQAQQADARTSRARARIVSPIDGVVIARTINLGQTLAASFQTPRLFEIATDLTDMRMEVAVNEADIAGVQVGQTVRFRTEAYPDEHFAGKIVQVQPQATERDNVVSFLAIASLSNRDNRLKSGMSTTAEIITASRYKALRVPLAAVSFRPPVTGVGKARLESISIRPSPRLTGGQPTPHRRVTQTVLPSATPQSGDHVWRISPETESGLVRVPVRLGVRGDRWVEVLAGDVKVGDTLATSLVSRAPR